MELDINMDPLQKQMLDDVFDAFTMLVRGTIVSLMHVGGGVTRYTPSAVELFGLPGEYISNGAYDWNDYLHPEDRKRYMDVMVPLLEGKSKTYDITYRVRTKGGEYGNFRAVGAVLRDENGKPSLIGGAMFNEGLTNTVDPVTVLPNKYVFLDSLGDMILEEKNVITLLVGVSGMTEINRVHGYTYGNRLLQETSWLLQEVVRDRARVFRGDGANFLLLSDTLSRQQMSAIYDMIRYRLQRGIEINGVRNILIANGGMVSAYSQDTEASTVLTCLHYAYEESKNHKHGELVDFNGSIHYDQTTMLEMTGAIRDSINNSCEGFSLRYVPVIDAGTGNINGAEAVLCWEKEPYGEVNAEDFLPILERDFIFEELGEFMLRQGMTEAVRFLEKRKNFLLCMNVYRIQLESDMFVDDLLYLLEETHFPAELLSLKFASDCRYIEHHRLVEIINRLHEYRILVIIDGFGSGADSISFLKNAPVDAVCLDSQFLNGIVENERDRDILEYLTKMAATCVTHINTAGVVSEAQREIIRRLPVTTMQGSLFFPLLRFEEMMEHW